MRLSNPLFPAYAAKDKLIQPSMIVIASKGDVLNYYDDMHESPRGRHHQADGSIPQFRSP
jgi:hypothetical protein